MKNIIRVNLVNNTTEEIAIFDSEITRWFDERGYDVSRNLIKIKAEVPSGKNESEETDRINCELTHYANCGFKFPVAHNMGGITYVPLFAAASDVRKATSTWINKEVAEDFWKWAMCGLTLQDISGKIAINKYMAYIGLLASASKRFEEAFGKKIDIRRVAVVKDRYVKVKGHVDFVKGVNVEHNVERELEINAFDGFAIIREELTDGESCSLRPGPWGKAFAQATNFKGLPAKFVDFWGREVNTSDVDIIMFESCFKAAKLYKSWEQYCDNFETLGHNVCVCVREHKPELKGMPYQQAQTLLGNDEDVALFAEHSVETVSKYQKIENAVNLLSKWQKAAAKIYNPLLKESHTAQSIQDKYTSKKTDMLGGRIPELGYNAFIAPDMVAAIQGIYGLEITGVLKAGECYCSNCKSGSVDITRNPHLDNAHVVLNNVNRMPFVSKKSPTMFINIWDLTTIQLRCDYDGDHVWYTQNPIVLDLVRRTYDQINNLPVDWVAPSAPKSVVNKATITTYIASLTKGSEIGLYADALTKMWANSYDRDICAWLTYAGNVLIDAAKHGGVKVERPENVKENDKNSLPEFCRFAKADKDHPADSAYWNAKRISQSGKTLPPRTAYSDSFEDKFSRKINETVPDVLTVEGLDELVFDSSYMLINPKRKLGRLSGLVTKPRSVCEDGTWEDGGVFFQIAFRHAEEWKKLVNFEAFQCEHEKWEEAKAEEARKEMIQYVRDQYADNETISSFSDEKILDAVYDIVCRRIFNIKMTEGLETVVKNAFWRIFGEKCYNVLRSNLELKNEEN